MDAENLMRKYSRRLDYKRNLRRSLSLSDYPSRRFRKLGCQVGCAEMLFKRPYYWIVL